MPQLLEAVWPFRVASGDSFVESYRFLSALWRQSGSIIAEPVGFVELDEAICHAAKPQEFDLGSWGAQRQPSTRRRHSRPAALGGRSQRDF